MSFYSDFTKQRFQSLSLNVHRPSAAEVMFCHTSLHLPLFLLPLSLYCSTQQARAESQAFLREDVESEWLIHIKEELEGFHPATLTMVKQPGTTGELFTPANTHTHTLTNTEKHALCVKKKRVWFCIKSIFCFIFRWIIWSMQYCGSCHAVFG